MNYLYNDPFNHVRLQLTTCNQNWGKWNHRLREMSVFTRWAPIMTLLQSVSIAPEVSHLLSVILTSLVTSLGSHQSTSVAYSLEAFSILSSILQKMSELHSFLMFYLCVRVCVYYVHMSMGAYAYTRMYTTEKNIDSPALSLWLILLRQRLSLNLKLGCLAVSSPPVFTPTELKLQTM